jgi:hypothetical protein
LGRSPRETVTPLVQQKAVWAGATLGSYQQSEAALAELAGVNLAPKQVQRITSQIGTDRVHERRAAIEQYRRLTIMQRTAAPPGVAPPHLAVIMMDGGRYQRRDDFRERKTHPVDGQPMGAVPTEPPSGDASENPTRRKTHWHEDKLGLVLSMKSKVYDHDPAPEFPEWLADAPVVAELAKLAERDERAPAADRPESSVDSPPPEPSKKDWKDLAPELLTREMIASGQDSEAFGWHLEHRAWAAGVPAAPRQAFVADGLSVNWTIHRKHFSQMTGVLDLMHGLSYAWRAAAALQGQNAYRRYATWIWQGKVERVIDELREHQKRIGPSDKAAGVAAPCNRVADAITYYQNHRQWMNYPAYRVAGLPLTSSHVESAMKQINARMKGTEKFWRADNGEALLQLRADVLSDSQPMPAFWLRWQSRQTGANQYRNTVA